MIIREFVTKLGFKVDTAKLGAFDRRLGNTKKKLKSLTGNIDSVARGMRNTGLIMTATISLPLTLLGIRALKTASDFEQLDVAFTTILGSADAAQKMIKDLLAFAAKTPFEIKDVQQNAKLLLGMGIEAEKIIPTMNALGNVAAGLSVPIERIAMNYGQVKAQTKLTGMELRDFARAGIPIIRELAVVLGIQEDAVKDYVSAGKVGFKDVEQAFMNMSAAGGTFHDLMIKQSRTLAGRWSNLMDIMTVFGAEFGNMIDETFNLKENLEKLTEWFEKLTVKFKSMAPWQRKLIVWLGAVVILIPVIMTLLGSLVLAILAVGTAIAIVETIGLPVLLLIAAAVAAIVVQLAILGAAIYVIIDDFQTWREGGDSVLGSLLGNFRDFANKVKFIWLLLKNAFSALWEALTTGSDEAWERFKMLMSKVWAHIMKIFSDVKERIEARFGPIDELIEKILMKIGNRLAEASGTILKILGKIIWNSFKFIFKEIDNLITGWLQSVSERVNTWFIKKFPKLSKFLLTEDYLAGRGGGNVPPTTLPPGALATAGTKSNTQNVNINSRVDLTVPEGTSQQQEQFLQTSADKIFDKKLNDMIGMSMEANPQVED
jgi:tape measure domain-containing protein